MKALPLPVEPLYELHAKDFPGLRNPKGGLCNAGLAKIDGGWLLIARNNSTPGRRIPINGRYENHLHTIWLTDEFRLAAHEPSQVVCADFHGCPQDVRVTADARKGYPHVLSGCFRAGLGSHFRVALGTMQQNNNVLSFVRAPVSAPIFGNGDQKNWVPLCGSIHDLGWNEKSGEHLAMIFPEGGSSAMPSVAVIPTPLQGNRKPRPAAPGFNFLDRRYMSYHNHDMIGGHRKYFHQFARFREESVDIESSTPPMRFTHHDEYDIQFLTGAVPVGSDLIVSYGVNDEFNVVGRVKMEDILQHLP